MSASDTSRVSSAIASFPGCLLLDIAYMALGIKLLVGKHISQRFLPYFQSALQKLPAPNGVVESLDKIAHIMDKPNIAEADIQEVLAQVKRIQSLLG